jgi:hypothetical protein
MQEAAIGSLFFYVTIKRPFYDPQPESSGCKLKTKINNEKMSADM